MKSQRIRLVSALAAVGLLFAAAPAHADDTSQAPSVTAIIGKPDPSERFPSPRPPRHPICPVKPAPPGWMVPLYCDTFPVQPPVDQIKPPVDRIEPIIPKPIMPSPILRKDSEM